MTDKSSAATPVLQPLVQTRILVLREQRVMLDADLAQLYGVETRSLVQAVKRNLMRFPDDFMIHLSAREFADLRSQPVNSSAGYGGRRPAAGALRPMPLPSKALQCCPQCWAALAPSP